MTDIKNAENAKGYICENCDFTCSKKSNYTSHLTTAKHLKLTNASNKPSENAIYKCICGNEYKHRQSLHKHKQVCIEIADANYKNKSTFKKVEQNIQSIMALSNFY